MTENVEPKELLRQLASLHAEMRDLEASGQIDFTGVHADHRSSATNLLHYLALRRHDIRQLQGNSPLWDFPLWAGPSLTS